MLVGPGLEQWSLVVYLVLVDLFIFLIIFLFFLVDLEQLVI